jgi:hypothetical protein
MLLKPESTPEMHASIRQAGASPCEAPKESLFLVLAVVRELRHWPEGPKPHSPGSRQQPRTQGLRFSGHPAPCKGAYRAERNNQHPGCAADAATLGFGVWPFQGIRHALPNPGRCPGLSRPAPSGRTRNVSGRLFLAGASGVSHGMTDERRVDF